MKKIYLIMLLSSRFLLASEEGERLNDRRLETGRDQNYKRDRDLFEKRSVQQLPDPHEKIPRPSEKPDIYPIVLITSLSNIQNTLQNRYNSYIAANPDHAPLSEDFHEKIKETFIFVDVTELPEFTLKEMTIVRSHLPNIRTLYVSSKHIDVDNISSFICQLQKSFPNLHTLGLGIVTSAFAEEVEVCIRNKKWLLNITRDPPHRKQR
jgi:hypothetical protein